MNRRALLAALAAGSLSGCLFASSDDVWVGSPSIDVEAESLVSGLSFTGTVVAGFGPDDAASIELALENVGDDRRTVGFGAIPPFTTLEGSTEDGALLYLLPEDTEDVESPSGDRANLDPTRGNGCWRLGAVPTVDDSASTVTLDPDESLARTYRVAGPPYGACPPDGEYEFESDEGHDVDDAGSDVGLRVVVRLTGT